MHIDENTWHPDPEQLKRDGYQLLRGFYSREECVALARAIAAAPVVARNGKPAAADSAPGVFGFYFSG